MSKLTAIKKQIAALEAEAERLTRQEMAGAIAKVKEIMATFGLTIEHLQAAAAGKGRAAAKTMKRQRAGGGVAKYADPKTGKTWSGFGRAPAWIAGAKSRDAFLVDKSGIKAPEAAAKASAARKKSAARKAPAKKPVGAARKAVRKSAAPAAAKKKPSIKRASPRKPAKKMAASKGAAAASTAAEGASRSAT